MDVRKISFSEVFKNLSSGNLVRNSIKNLSYFIPILLYGCELIFLLKISQLVLGWQF